MRSAHDKGRPMPNFLSKILSMGADRELKEFERLTARVNELEPRFKAMADEELHGMTALLRERHAQGETLDDLLPEAFAAVREASVRTIGLRHFDVQIVGGIALHRGTIAEMKTGEGKTLVSTLAGYLNAIPARCPHRHCERLPRPPRQRVDGEHLPVPGHERGPHPERHAPRHEEAGLRGRRDVRHQLGVRLRLPPRQHGHQAGHARPARAPLRHRGRGRLHPHRRGEDAPHHLRRRHQVGEHLQGLRACRARPHPRRRLRNGTRPSTRSRRPRRVSRRSSARSASTTSTAIPPAST